MEELEIILNGEIVNIKIIRKNNKNIYFRFNDQNELVVTVHPRISTKKVLKLIKENEKSLAKMYMRSKNKQAREDETRILGLKYDIKINENYHDVTFDDGIIYVNSKNTLDKYINNLTKKIFREEVNKILEIMPDIPEFTLKVRKMKSRWGVCNYVKKTVTLNSELIKYERSIIDYVIVHEFSHFTHHDHSTAFWALVSTYYPDYKKARKELREH